MLQRLFGEKIYHTIILFLYAVIVVFLPLNKPVLSITIVVLTVFVFLGHSLKHLKESILQKKPFLWLAIFLLWIIISLFWTENTTQGLRFINLIIPFFLLAFSFFIHPVQSEKERDFLLLLFTLSVTITTVVNTIYFFQEEHGINYDRRQMSLFVSHIRLSLMVVLSILYGIYFWLKKKQRWRHLLIPIIAFLVYYLFISEVVSGFIAFVVLLSGGFIYFIHQQITSKKWFYLMTFSFFFVAIASVLFFYRSFTTMPSFKVLETTAQGNPYRGDSSKIMYENGIPINLNISYKEVTQEWQKRSDLDLNEPAYDGILYQWNVIRYMTSKGLIKDAEGVRALTDQDIKNIENGHVSILDGRKDLYARYIRLKDEYNSTGMNPNGYTYLQRAIYWKTGRQIFRDHPIIGVGVGDAVDTFHAYYEKDDSPLNQENRRTSHQQFLSIGVSFGVIGLILFLFFLISSIRASKSSVIGLISIAIITVSFLNEDTMETMVGAMLCGLVFGLFASRSFQSSQQKEGLSNESNQEQD